MLFVMAMYQSKKYFHKFIFAVITCMMYPSGSTGNKYVSNSVTFALSTYNYHRIFATDTLVKFKITAEVSGSRYTNGSHSETQSGTSVLITEQKKLTLIGNDGFAITIGSTNQFTVQEIADELVMKFKGKMDIPGVLLSGIGFSAGGGTDMWGKTHTDYDVVFLGFPIWWYRAPKIINTFLESYDFSGKTIILFATSGGSPLGKSADYLKGSCSATTIIKNGKIFSNHASEKELAEWV